MSAPGNGRRNTRARTSADEKRRGFKSAEKITNAIERRRSNGRQIFFSPSPGAWYGTIDKGRAARDSTQRAEIGLSRRGGERLRDDARGIEAGRAGEKCTRLPVVRYIIENLAQIAIEKLQLAHFSALCNYRDLYAPVAHGDI